MESRKIQRSGTTYYLYLPASWCREHKITTNSTVYLEKNAKGDLVVEPKKTESSLLSLKFELTESSPEVINKMIIASYINPIKEFEIKLKEPLSPDQILKHKALLGGLELVDFEDTSILCQTALALSDPDVLLMSMIKKILSMISLMKKSNTHELILKYEQELDKTNILIQKSIISSLMYKKETKLMHAELYYIGLISRTLERIGDILISLKSTTLIDTIDKLMKRLLGILERLNQTDVIKYVKEVEKLDNIKVKDIESYKEKRLYQNFGHISETLCDWLITKGVSK